MKVRAILIAAALMAGPAALAASKGAAKGPGTLCDKDEQTLFNCKIKSGKLISLCGTKRLTDSVGTLQYRFGKPGNLELQYPLGNGETQKLFHYSRYTRPDVAYLGIEFSNDDASYKLFSESNQEDSSTLPSYGVRINSGGKESDVKCVGGVTDNLTVLESVLPHSDKE